MHDNLKKLPPRRRRGGSGDFGGLPGGQGPSPIDLLQHLHCYGSFSRAGPFQADKASASSASTLPTTFLLVRLLVFLTSSTAFEAAAAPLHATTHEAQGQQEDGQELLDDDKQTMEEPAASTLRLALLFLLVLFIMPTLLFGLFFGLGFVAF
mmetsp:Transcript_145622/g.252877  ORF Transcript_145622/g.252877 Transcript_145622/m.252877 type:complete len:152 (+) Transcript_145622:48-503(+)